MNFNHILEKHRKLAVSERDKGDRFERLIQTYLLTDPKYSSIVEKVWLWSEFPFRSDIGGADVGIDLVAQTVEGDYWALQSKCFQEGTYIDKATVDTFLATSGRSFKDNSGKRVKFSNRLWVSTTNNWSSNANESLRNQDPPVSRINLTDLQESPVDWKKIDQGIFGEKARIAKKTLFPHQQEALIRTKKYFEKNERGKMIMACGTGKTFTSLRIAEEVAGQNGIVLFLVPSIALLGQTLREWTSDASEDIHPICICSDREVSKEKKKNEDTDTYSIVDLALPASTSVNDILQQFEYFEMKDRKGLTVVFSTYQSIEVISKTQNRLESIGSKYSQFDLIICDEAHRTTGVTLANDDESAFVKVHNNNFIKSSKRLYMTATPRLYSEESKSKAARLDAVLASMDDESMYGQEIYRIGFGEAVERDLLSDYKVLILTLSEDDITPEVQKIIKDDNNEISTDDISKLIGCINAMSKQILGDSGNLDTNDPEPMRRAVAFCQSIKVSKKITETFNTATSVYKESLPESKKANLVNLKSDHIDGTMSATQRDQMMSWLKSESPDPREARVLTNVRCLSEGVDVPSLDAVMFLSARNSQVDVVQSVGRVMRKSPGKKYGYIIIPIVVPSDVKPEEALNDNERYKVVWTVLNALRAHDDRFNATVNKIELNKKRPDQILVGRVDPDGDGDPSNDPMPASKESAKQMTMHFEAMQSVIYAKLVEKVGTRGYWENWAKSVAEIAEKQIKRITKLVNEKGDHQKAFQEFLNGLRKNINPSVTEEEAIEMLSQHIITKPIFEALFEDYSFVENNVVSVSMQETLTVIEASAVEQEELEVLEEFYTSVRRRVEGIDNAEAKQKIIIELYDKFFKAAFPKMVEQLGIVFTPVEVVDFIIHSVDDLLQKEFGRSISDENINILDPFTGTGTFITRLLQSGLIKSKDLERKYKNEIFANEIVLLAYYIAAVNIENTYHDLLKKDEYETFEGIVLTDTFQLSETEDNKLFSESLTENSERVEKQKNTPLRIIIGNPPYSIGQKSANDNAKNQDYPYLDKNIEKTYASLSESTTVRALYDPYIKAFRWSTDRLDSKHGGIIGFVSNGGWLDGNSMDGFRKTIEKEFSSIWVFNLRGDQRTSGEMSRSEGGKIFGSGSRTPITITFLVKNPKKVREKADIKYHDIGDYLSRERKLEIIKEFGSIFKSNMEWNDIQPNDNGDWIKQRSIAFETYQPLAPQKKFNLKANSIFVLNSLGINTNRDAWVYNFSKKKVSLNMKNMVDFYNSQVKAFIKAKDKNIRLIVKDFMDTDPTKISWSSSLIPKLEKGKLTKFNPNSLTQCLYRPYCKQNMYSGQFMLHRRGQMDQIFPLNLSTSNLAVITHGKGGKKNFSVLMSDISVDLNCLDAGAQCFPLYYYNEEESTNPSLFDNGETKNVIRQDGVSDFILERARSQYVDKGISKEDIFYYVYGILHSPDYRETFANDLKKMLPHVPLVEDVKDFWAFSKAGRELADLHINYEKVPPYEGVKVSGTQHGDYKVKKMKFIDKDTKDAIIYNKHIKLENIPEKAYKYVVNGRSAIEWIMDRYQITTDTKGGSGIVNDPNDWAEETNQPRYILDLLLSVINVSVQTVDIVNDLPKLTFETDQEE